MRKMHEGVSHSKKIKRARREGIDAWDDKWKMRAKQLLDEAILSGEVDIYAEFVSERPKRLSPEIWQAGIRRNGQGLPTLAYIDRHVMAPFGLPWTVAKELRQAQLLVNKDAFRAWLRKEMRKKAWPCHTSGVSPKRGRGWPRDLRDGVIEILENLIETKKLTSSARRKRIRELVQKARPSLAKVSMETVLRACSEIGFEFSSS